MKRTKHLETFLSKNFFLMSLLAALIMIAPAAQAGNEPAPVTTVSIENINADIELPKNMRSGRPAAQVNNLGITNFDVNTITNGFLSVNFSAEGKGNMYVRIVNQEGMDVYFETVKGDAQSYNKQIETAALKPGIYYLQVTRGDKTFNKKLILN